MPAPSTESSDKKGVVEPTNPMKQVITIVEKKVRNLEKRKNKLDLIKKKADSGDTLQEDQQIAIKHYDEVIQTLEYSRELQKQFTAIQTEATKMLRKQARKEKLERHQHEMERIQELLKVQNLLDSLGSQSVRSDFQTGKHGAVVLTEENLNQLDELYQRISPTREGEGNYHEKLSAAGEHIVSLLDRRQKEVIGIGTTYKELKELIDLISGCGYFEAVEQLQMEAVKVNEETESAIAEGQTGENTEIASSEDDKTESQADEPAIDYPISQAPQESLEQVAPPQLNSMAPNTNAGGFYPAEAYEPPSQRPIDEIVSAVQGSFDFLQESTIDVDSAPHNDPAVVVAQPMTRPIAQQTRESDTQQHPSFGGQPFDRQTDPASAQPGNISSNNLSHQHPDQSRYNTQDLSLSQQNLDFASSQSFHQNALSQNLQNDSLFPGAVEESSQIAHGIMNQPGSDNSMGQFEIPPTIPMPQTQDGQQSNISNQSEKKFTMNAAAPVFQSQYSQYTQQDQIGDGPNHIPQNTDSSGGNYQNNRYQNDGFQQRGPRRDGGGFRGRGGRGGGGSGGNGNGPASNGNMQNGFRSGGGGQNSGRGGRAGSYQGYPPRNNYQPDGYQGYGNSGGFNQGYKQRGGNNQGPARGANSGSGMRGSGGMRGGSQRGTGGNTGQRSGGPRGGFGRPNPTQYQQ